MAEAVNRTAALRRDAYQSQRRQVRRMVAAASMLFLPAVLLRRLAGRTRAAAGERLSIFAEARAGAAAVIPFIFMG